MNRNIFPQIKKGAVYADWTGAALAQPFLIQKHSEFLQKNILGNPHSHHSPSVKAMEQVKETRQAILDYFNASHEEYEVIFTANATGAIRILGHFLFGGGELLLTADNHNSVNGLRETAKRNGGAVRYAPINDSLAINEEALLQRLNYPRSSGNKLFAYPLKSNYTGNIHSTKWVELAQKKGWRVLLDAAAYVSNNRLDLSQIKPDYVPISFYKMFGYPTGVGCLIIKKEAYAQMHKQWFSGGSILLVSVMKDFFAPEALGYARYEDGSINFAQIMAVKAGLEFMKDMGGELGKVGKRTATKLYDELVSMDVDGNSVIIHSARGNDVVTFSIKKGGGIINAWEFEKAANKKMFMSELAVSVTQV